MKLTDKITEFMKVNNIKDYKAFSEFADVPYTTIKSFYDKGYANAKRETLVKLKKAMNLTLDEIADDNIDVDFKVKVKVNTKSNEILTPNTIIAIGNGGKKIKYEIPPEKMELANQLLSELSKKK